MRPLIFIDIDDNVVVSLRKIKMSGAEPPHVVVAPGTCITTQQLALLNMFSLLADLVPTTGRGYESLARLAFDRLCLRPPFPGHRICYFGGVICDVAGKRLPAWRELVGDETAKHKRELVRLFNSLALHSSAYDIACQLRLVEDDGVTLFIRAKCQRESDAVLISEFLKSAMPDGFDMCWNERNLAVLPPSFSKRKAVSWYKKYLGSEITLTIGSGDSLSDLDFMETCDYLLIPRSAQILYARNPLPGGLPARDS